MIVRKIMENRKKKLKCELYNDSMQSEEWKAIDGYEHLYQVSNLGRVRSVSHYARNNRNGGVRYVEGRLLSTYKMPNGYHQVQLSKNSSKEKKYVHRLVACAFIENSKNLEEVNHIDGDKSNNKAENLEWVNHKDNQIYTIKMMRTKKAMPVIYLETKDTYMSLSEAEKATGIYRRKIKKMCEEREGWDFL